MKLVPAWLALAVYLPAQDIPRLRVAVTVVQVDAVVTDRSGHPVSDLTREDFELFEDGQLREVTYCTYIRTGPSAATPRSIRPGIPGAYPLERQNVGRVIALLVDDLHMSFTGLHFTREALGKFVDRELAPGDLVSCPRNK